MPRTKTARYHSRIRIVHWKMCAVARKLPKYRSARLDVSSVAPVILSTVTARDCAYERRRNCNMKWAARYMSSTPYPTKPMYEPTLMVRSVVLSRAVASAFEPVVMRERTPLIATTTASATHDFQLKSVISATVNRSMRCMYRENCMSGTYLRSLPTTDSRKRSRHCLKSSSRWFSFGSASMLVASKRCHLFMARCSAMTHEPVMSTKKMIMKKRERTA
mmetsp:Transcript_20360/g.63257  ORF Transcript_20360/g.63257 Transcript_20360/m.63257 type:complete len:219 (-) Transcript_20360:365-1021(-)